MIETLLSSLTWKIKEKWKICLKEDAKFIACYKKKKMEISALYQKNNIADQCFAMLFDEHES